MRFLFLLLALVATAFAQKELFNICTEQQAVVDAIEVTDAASSAAFVQATRALLNCYLKETTLLQENLHEILEAL